MSNYTYDNPDADTPEDSTKVATIIFQPPSNPTTIGTLEVDVLLEYSEDYQSQVPDHPTEEGYFVHDHVINEPMTLQMTVFITPTPVTWSDRFGGSSETRITDAIETLKEIRRKREPITIVSSSGVAYENMILESMSLPRNATDGYSLTVPLTFKEIRKVQTRTAIIPSEVSAAAKNKVGTTEQNTGEAGDASSSYSSSNNDGTTTPNSNPTTESYSSLAEDAFGGAFESIGNLF